jgi:hypothetical protein
MSDMGALYKLHEASRRGEPFKWNKVEGTADDTIPHRDIEETKTAEPLSSSPSSPSSAPVSPRSSQDQCHFGFFEDHFHWSIVTDIMRGSTRFGATYSEPISTRRHATTTAFEAFEA